MKRDGIFSWLSVDRIKNLYSVLISVETKLRYNSQKIFDNDLDIPDLGTVKSYISSGINKQTFTEADLVSDGAGGFYLPYIVSNGEILLGSRIEYVSGGSEQIAANYDFVNSAITGISNDNPQNITVFATGVYTPPIPTPAPVFTLQPSPSLTVLQYENFTLTSLATGATSYQWYKNGVALAGETASSYSANMFSSGFAGTFYVIAFNSYGSTQSNNSVVAFDAGIVIWNRTDTKSPMVGGGSNTGRTIQANWGIGLTNIGINSQVRVSSSVSSITIRQSGADNLILFDGGSYRSLVIGSNVDNGYTSPFIELIIYNDN